MIPHDPPGWDEAAYLAANPEVEAAVDQGVVRDGYHHYLLLGRFDEGRTSGFADPLPAQTRLCFDPWINAEFTVDGHLKPCCRFLQGTPLDDAGDVAAVYNAPQYRQLRHGLLTGRLAPECEACHIRPMAPARDLVGRLFPHLPAGADLLDAGTLETVRIDVTHKCNLRCVYCALSVAGSHGGRHMTDENLARVAAFTGRLENLRMVAVNGHGETTHHPGWKNFCDGLLERGAPLSIITNLGRAYAEDEIATLALFRIIEVSLDTADETLLRRIRRKVELPRILANITAIRARAIGEGLRPPMFSFSCGLYDKSIVGLEAFAALTVAADVRSVTFWDLQKYPDLPGAENVQPLSSLDDEALRHALGCFDRALAVFARHKVRVAVAGGFIEPLRTRLTAPVEAGSA